MTILIRSGAADTDVINVLYQNIFAEGTLSWTSQADGFNAANAIEDGTWNSWSPTSVAAQFTVDYGSPVTCDAIGIAAHNMASNGASFRVQQSTDNITWNSVSVEYAPLINEDIFILFASTSARYWRLSLLNAVANIGVIKLGQAVKFPCAPISGHKPLHHARKFELLSNESMGGNFLSNRVVKIGAETSVNIGQVDRTWAETSLIGFEAHYNAGGAFFYCGSPSATPKDMGYCKRPPGSDEMNVTWVEGDAMADVSFDVRSYVAG